MELHAIEQRFNAMGARLRVAADGEGRGFSLAVCRDGRGEFFELRPDASREVQIAIVDQNSLEQRLLVVVKQDGRRQKFVCGHDERRWFVSPVGEATPAARPAARAHSRHATFLRQGDWFFLPSPALRVSRTLVRRDEPLPGAEGGSPHVAERCYRSGSGKLYVRGCIRHPDHKTIELRCWHRAIGGGK